MKNKSTRHKETNTFKFRPFSERISSIDIDVFHRVAHEYETETEEDTCFFYQAIQKWNVLNLTESYSAFRKEVKAHTVITLPQLLHNKDSITQVLLKHLKYKNALCLQPLLELTVAVAQDLRKDFYAYYSEFLDVLIELLNTKDTEQLEWVFTCLAYLFKVLWRTLIKDVATVFKKLSPLLSDNKPQYINNFAAESFAFVARKVKDRKLFLNLILKSVKHNQDGVTGCGKLLFEIVYGTNGQFHSCADAMLPFYFDCLQDEKIPRSLLQEILEQIVQNITTNIRPEGGELFWSVCLGQLEKTSAEWSENPTEHGLANLDFLLKCLGQGVEYRSGRFLQKPAPLIAQVLKLLSVANLSDTVVLTVTKIVILLLLSKNIRLQQEQASTLTKKILAVPMRNVLLHFVENSLPSSLFEALILPSFLKHCVSYELDEECLKVLSNLILKKSPLCENGMKLEEWNKYAIDFGYKQLNLKMESVLFNHINAANLEQINAKMENYLLSLICLPHVNLQNVDEIGVALTKNIQMLCDYVKNSSCDDESNLTNLYTLYNTLMCAVHLMTSTVLSDLNDTVVDGVSHLCNSVTHITALRTLDLYLSAVSSLKDTLTKERLIKLHDILEKNFDSPYHEVRLLTTHIYSLFETTVDLKPHTSTEEWNVFSLCYKIESIEPQVHTYREQLLYLERLNFDNPQMTMCKDTEFRTVPLRYLCGVLYMNFKLLWDPIMKIISTHAMGLDRNVFWNIYSKELRTVVENVASTRNIKDVDVDFSCPLLVDLYKDAYKVVRKPDFSNYRLLLWKGMCLFPEVAEAKTRDISEIFLTFVGSEYTKSNTDVALTWNIKQNPDISVSQSVETEEIVQDETDSEKRGKASSGNLKTLTHHLNVFAKMRNPKAMYREPELYKLYLDLLSHKNYGVQKLALDCIMTYKFKYLSPYRDNLYNLIDDKNFKNELTTFRVDKESSAVQEEHRENLIPIVMKIVFSKMVAKTGLRTGGKSSGQLRRNLILRFLAGCHDSEMTNFVRMAFRYYEKYLEDDPEIMVDKISDDVTLEKFISPKKLQSSVNLLNVILEQFGGLMGDSLLKYLLKILLTIGACLKGALRQYNDLHAGYLPILRNLRTSTIKLIGRFFEHFEKYPWTSQEINAVFDVFVWPYLDKLNIEGIHSPTTLLRLLILWGTHPRYFPLLVKHRVTDENQYALPHIMRLLLNEKTHVSVTNAITEMIEKLLTLQPDEEDLRMKTPVDNELPIEADILEKVALNEKLNYGSCILLPHVTSVLEKIKRRLESKSKNINQRQLFVLSRISELVWESGISDKVLQLLLPVVLKKSASAGEEVILQLVTTLNNLMQNVSEPLKHLKQISPLFGEITYPSSRKVLCQILNTVAEKCNPAVHEEMSTASALIGELNAWDLKWVDQPDFQRRSDAFRLTQKMVEENTVTVELGVLLIYNCYHLIRSERDLSLRENSTHCLRSMCPTLVKKYEKSKEKNYILDETLLNLIRNGLRNRNDDIRNECIQLLGHLSCKCPDSHVILRDLHKLTNRDDPEVDFFENITHMQVHRHARALLKFCNVFKQESTLPNVRTLTQFILPLTTHYLCNEKYSNKNSIIDAAIETVGVVCRLLQWHHYEGLLKFYLGKLRYKVEYQKQLVRLTVVILDSFHFDLSKAQTAPMPEAVQENKDGNTEIVVKDVANDGNPVSSEPEEQEEIEEKEPEIDEVLGNVDDDLAEMEEEEPKEEVLLIKPHEKIAVLCKSTANRVTSIIQAVLLPQLHKALAEMTHHEVSHKINKKKTSVEREEEDLLRVPISLAVVKLLQKLPKGILEANLPGVFMKLCSFLRSQLESVRRVTRETLQKIMITLGPEYLSLLLDQMTPLLSRGFQVHVLVYTVHAVLAHLKDMYRPGDIDKILLTVINLCRTDLFGSLAEEKEVAKIVSKVSEAKSTKSVDTFQILAQFVTDKCLMDLLLPIKGVLSTSHSYKTVHKAQECLKRIALGLVDNEFVQVESLLKFSYGTASESIPELLTGKDQAVLTEKEREKLERRKPDCFIIPKEPVYRSGHRTSSVKSSAKTNAHVLVEFGLRLCYFLLKRDKLREDDHKPFVDPFVAVFKNCLQSKHVKLGAVTLQCLGWVMRHDLPSMRDNIKDITKAMFEILHKYAAAGLSKGDNFDLVVAAFKTMSILVRDVKYHMIDAEQLKILLLYVEQDLHDYDRQATAFGLLKAIISRKLIVPEIHDIMRKVAELSITSELTHVRTQTRLVFHQFLLDYPLGKKLEKHVSFYISQLSYELQSGREAALEMIQSLVYSFPMNVLRDYSGTFLVTLGARLVNDESPECRRRAADCISSMFARMSRPDRDPLFDIIVLWMKDNKINHRRLAAQLCGILVMVEKSSFESRIKILMPVIMLQFGLGEVEEKPGRFVRLKRDDEIENEEKERVKDHHKFQVLQLLLKICAQCPSFLKQSGDVESIAVHVQALLAYPHEWVRLAAAQFLGFVLSSLDIDHLASLLASDGRDESGYLCSDPVNGVKSLTLDLCSQLQPKAIKSDLAEQVVKNLVFIARVLQHVPMRDKESNKTINLLWLTKRMRKIVNTEVVEAPSSIILRKEVFKWIGGVGTALKVENILIILQHLLAPLVREMITTEESNAPLRQLSKEVGNLLKRKVGMETYSDALSKLQQHLSVKRAERKRARSQLAVTDPEVYAKKKIKHHEKKKEAKKRKVSQLKGAPKTFKRRKVADLEDNSEVI